MAYSITSNNKKKEKTVSATGGYTPTSASKTVTATNTSVSTPKSNNIVTTTSFTPTSVSKPGTPTVPVNDAEKRIESLRYQYGNLSPGYEDAIRSGTEKNYLASVTEKVKNTSAASKSSNKSVSATSSPYDLNKIYKDWKNVKNSDDYSYDNIDWNKYQAPTYEAPEPVQAQKIDTPVYQKKVAEHAMDIEGVANEVGRIIDEYKQGTADQQVVLAAQLQQMLETLDAQEQKMTSTINQQIQGDDPAMREAFRILKEQFSEQQKQLMEELNAKGVLQSGQYAKVLSDYQKGLQTGQQSILAQRFGDLQNRLLTNMEEIGKMRVAVMQGNFDQVNQLLANSNLNVANLGMQGIGLQQNQEQIINQNNQFYDSLNADTRYKYDTLNTDNQYRYDALNTENQYRYDALSGQLARDFAQINAGVGTAQMGDLTARRGQDIGFLNNFAGYMNQANMNYEDNVTARRGQDVNFASDIANYTNQYNMNTMNNITTRRGQDVGLISDLENYRNQYAMNVNNNSTRRYEAQIQQQLEQERLRHDQLIKQWQYGVQQMPDGTVKTQAMRELEYMKQVNEAMRDDAYYQDAITRVLPEIETQLNKGQMTPEQAIQYIDALPYYSPEIKHYMKRMVEFRTSSQQNPQGVLSGLNNMTNEDIGRNIGYGTAVRNMLPGSPLTGVGQLAGQLVRENWTPISEGLSNLFGGQGGGLTPVGEIAANSLQGNYAREGGLLNKNYNRVGWATNKDKNKKYTYNTRGR